MKNEKQTKLITNLVLVTDLVSSYQDTLNILKKQAKQYGFDIVESADATLITQNMQHEQYNVKNGAVLAKAKYENNNFKCSIFNNDLQVIYKNKTVDIGFEIDGDNIDQVKVVYDGCEDYVFRFNEDRSDLLLESSDYFYLENILHACIKFSDNKVLKQEMLKHFNNNVVVTLASF